MAEMASKVSLIGWGLVRLLLIGIYRPKVSEACHRIAGKKGERKATGNRRKAVSKQLVLG